MASRHSQVNTPPDPPRLLGPRNGVLRLVGSALQEIIKKPADFASIAQIRCGKVGGAKKKWITSSRRENCRSSASISTSNSGRTIVGDSCASLRKLTAAVT